MSVLALIMMGCFGCCCGTPFEKAQQLISELTGIETASPELMSVDEDKAAEDTGSANDEALPVDEGSDSGKTDEDDGTDTGTDGADDATEGDGSDAPDASTEPVATSSPTRSTRSAPRPEKIPVVADPTTTKDLDELDAMLSELDDPEDQAVDDDLDDILGDDLDLDQDQTRKSRRDRRRKGR